MYMYIFVLLPPPSHPPSVSLPLSLSLFLSLFAYVYIRFLSDCVTQLFHLLLDCRECDTRMKVLNVLSLLMERMGVAIQPHVSALLQHLPQLWAESEDQSASMLRCVILSTLTNITRSLGAVSAQLHNFTLPVIHFTTDVTIVSQLLHDFSLILDSTHVHTSI